MNFIQATIGNVVDTSPRRKQPKHSVGTAWDANDAIKSVWSEWGPFNVAFLTKSVYLPNCLGFFEFRPIGSGTNKENPLRGENVTGPSRSAPHAGTV